MTVVPGAKRSKRHEFATIWYGFEQYLRKYIQYVCWFYNYACERFKDLSRLVVSGLWYSEVGFQSS